MEIATVRVSNYLDTSTTFSMSKIIGSKMEDPVVPLEDMCTDISTGMITVGATNRNFFYSNVERKYLNGNAYSHTAKICYFSL